MGQVPKLTADNIDEDAHVDSFISFVLDKPEARRRSRRTRWLQDTLRRQLTDEQWRAYLAIEQSVNERVVVESRVIARAAFEAGKRSRR